MVDEAKKGLEEAGCTVDLFQAPELLSEDVLGKMGAPPKVSIRELCVSLCVYVYVCVHVCMCLNHPNIPQITLTPLTRERPP